MTQAETAPGGLSPDRINGIGGSEAAAVLGLSPFKTRYQVWSDKRGLSGESEPTAAMEWGTRLEPVIRQWYSDKTGRTVRDSGHVASKEHPFMLCTPDGVTDDGRLLEVKTAGSSRDWGEPGTDEVPIHYQIQVQHNMVVTGLAVADLPVLIAGRDPRIYEVPADRELQQMIIEREAAFWKMVEAGEPPEAVSYADAVKRFARSKAQLIEADSEALAAVSLLHELEAAAKDTKRQEEQARFIILRLMGGADTLVDANGDVLVTCKTAKDSVRFDSKAFELAHPRLYKKFSVSRVGSRRFLLKRKES